MLRRSYGHVKAFCRGYFNLLLVFLIFLLFFRPYNSGELYFSLWQLCFTGVILSSVFNCKHTKIVKFTAISLAIPSIFLNIIAHYHHNELTELIFLGLTALFLLICISSIITKVILNAKVTLETLKGVICVYLMIAFAFAFIFLMIEYYTPGSFYFLTGIRTGTFEEIINFNTYLSQLIFFSFETLLTIGYGDIHPMRDLAQTFTIIEGAIGQFYIAILVARLISVYSLYSGESKNKRS